MFTYKFVVEYAGTRFSGWQEQKNSLTIAGELRKAITAAFEAPVEIGGAGRTDAGVHALAQVAHVRFANVADPRRLLRVVNEGLPADVNVLSITQTDERFHARHHAVTRTYLYQIAKRRTAFAKRYVWWIEDELDLALMREAIATCIGEHDFAFFCDSSKERVDTRVRMDRAEIAAASGLILLRFEASHFLWRMVRRLVGALVRVGLRSLSPAEFIALVEARPIAASRGNVADWTAPPSGLFLERVRYRGDAENSALSPAFQIERPPRDAGASDA